MAHETIPHRQQQQRRAQQRRARQRLLGAYYTPEPIVRAMLRSCFDGPLAERLRNTAEPVRILDPACGDGAFLLSALREIGLQGGSVDLSGRTEEDDCPGSPLKNSVPRATAVSAVRETSPFANFGTADTAVAHLFQRAVCAGTDVVAAHLFGADLDPHAIGDLQRRMTTALGPGAADSPLVKGVLTSNFRIGNALTGPGFCSTGTSEGEAADESTDPKGIDWQDAFPQIASADGFDLVIGNPPYLREKGAQTLFQRLAQSELGRRWRQPRMDLWHYFLHRGLDLLRPGGVLCYILNSYWMSARSAEPMIERLRAETTVREVVLLGQAPIFDGVSGRHMILQLQKRPTEGHRLREDGPCRVIDLSDIPDAEALLSAVSSLSPADIGADGKRVRQIPQESLYGQGRFHPHDDPHRPVGRGHVLLGEVLEVRQGIAENPPFVTRAIRDEIGSGLEVGDGLFVLTSEEVAALHLSEQERTLLRPYYVAKAVGRYELPPQPTHWILYLTRRTAPDPSMLPHILRHLGRVRPVLERRREVQRGTIDWWHLHWPRQERLFLEPRILAGQMGRRPRFVYAERPTFVGFSINVIRAPQTASFSLPVATAVLNSEWAADWFTRHAKHRGVALDISGTLLREFPFPAFDTAVEQQLSSLCLLRQQIAGVPTNVSSAGTNPQCQKIEREIESLL